MARSRGHTQRTATHKKHGRFIRRDEVTVWLHGRQIGKSFAMSEMSMKSIQMADQVMVNGKFIKNRYGPIDKEAQDNLK